MRLEGGDASSDSYCYPSERYRTSWPATLFGSGPITGSIPGWGGSSPSPWGCRRNAPGQYGELSYPFLSFMRWAIGVVVALAGLFQAVLPLNALKIGKSRLSFSGSVCTIWRDTVTHAGAECWSALGISPILVSLDGLSARGWPHGVTGSIPNGRWRFHCGSARLDAPRTWAAMGGSATNLSAVLVHTLGYLVVTGFVAWVVYEKLGLALLRKAWLNLDLIWAVALVVTGCFVLVI